MKRLAVLILFAAIVTGQSYPQWVQTSLGDAQYGYNLFSDSSGVWAATLNGVYQTADTGNPWFSWGLTGRLVFDVIKSGPNLLAATEGTGPGVYRTTDQGANWLSAVGIADQSVRAFAKNSAHVFACTWGGGVFRSSDNGATWQSAGLGNHGFRSIFTVGETVFVGGDSVFFSANNGSTWTGRGLPFPAGDTWCFAFHNGKLYAGDVGLYVSEDLGMTWSLVYGVSFDSEGTPVNTSIFRDLASHNQTLIAAMSPGGICFSQNGGAGWMDWNEGVMSDWIFAAIATRSEYILALRGAFGNAYIRRLSEITTGVEVANSSELAGFSLMQNYPNPFNPVTCIRYGVGVVSGQRSVASNVRLVVCDLLGREVEVLVDEQKQPGEYIATWDASGMASGVYFYRLTIGNQVNCKKMLLTR